MSFLPFPFSLTYESKLNNENSIDEILEKIKTEIKKHKVEEIEYRKNQLIFKVPFALSSWNLMAPVEYGKIEIFDRYSFIILKYKISIFRMILITSFMSLVFGLLSQSILFGIIVFFWLCVLNLVIVYIRQNKFFKHLKRATL